MGVRRRGGEGRGGGNLILFSDYRCVPAGSSPVTRRLTCQRGKRGEGKGGERRKSVRKKKRKKKKRKNRVKKQSKEANEGGITEEKKYRSEGRKE